MLIGVPKETKVHEYRVGLTPSAVRELIAHGHQVWVQQGAGVGIGADDGLYLAAGARIVETAEEVFSRSELIVKVKEPQPAERPWLREGRILFTYLHLAADQQLTRELQASGVIAIAYETVTAASGGLPLLAPMSEVAGRMAIQAGAACLEKERGGMGILLGGVTGVAPGKVTILGGGTVGRHAAQMALGLGARVVVIDRSLEVLRQLAAQFGPALTTLHSTGETIERHVLSADLVIGAVLIPGATAPKLVSAAMVRGMKPGSVVVDVAIDQGGCVATSRPTTHAEPTFVVEQVVHYCVTNMPGAVPRTSTHALNAATLPFVLALAGQGWKAAISADPHLRNGLNLAVGRLTHAGVAESLGLEYSDPLGLTEVRPGPA